METCDVCGWVDDLTQLVHPDVVLGANSGVSLREAQQQAHEVKSRAPGWRPLRPGEQPNSSLASPACALSVPEREGFVPYWKSRWVSNIVA